jgi:hypothetical protein
MRQIVLALLVTAASACSDGSGPSDVDPVLGRYAYSWRMESDPFGQNSDVPGTVLSADGAFIVTEAVAGDHIGYRWEVPQYDPGPRTSGANPADYPVTSGAITGTWQVILRISWQGQAVTCIGHANPALGSGDNRPGTCTLTYLGP